MAVNGKRLWLAPVPLVLVCAVVYHFQPSGVETIRVGPDWLPGDFAAALGRAEPRAWEARAYGAGVTVLRRAGSADGWEALWDMAQGSPRRFSAAPGRLLVVRQASASSLAADDPHLLDLHPLTVRGHPDELVKIAERFTR